MSKISVLIICIFYPLVVVCAVVLLASVELRASSGSAYDTWRLQYNNDRAEAQTNAAKLTQLQKQKNENDQNVSFTDLCLKFFKPDGTSTLTDGTQLRIVKAAQDADVPYTAFKGTMRCMLRGQIWLTFDKNSFDSMDQILKTSLANLEKEIEANQKEYEDLVRGRQDFVSLHELEKVRYANLIVLAPYDLLVLLLVMFMGALGGMARLLREYGNKNIDNPAPNDYLIVPLIGVVVSIGGFVAAKAGALLLSSSKDASLSPFTIGLVGVISGLMAKEVIDSIRLFGIKMFSSTSKA